MHCNVGIRHQPHRLLLSIFSTLVLLLQAGPAMSEADAKPLDVVVILADDMGYSDLGCYGSEISTPHLDQLAKRGVRFTNFYNTARCCPSRASLMTGLWPHQAEMGWMTAADMGRPGYSNQLLADAVTIPERLKPAGYDTYMLGKWHLTHTDELKNGPNGSWPTQRGFDRYYGTLEGAKNYFRPSHLHLDNTPIKSEDLPDDYFYTYALADQASEWIHAQPLDSPMFMYVAFYAPHFPLQAPADLIAEQRGRYLSGWDALREQRLARQKQLGIFPPHTTLSPRHPKVQPWDTLDNKRKDEMDLRMATYAAQVRALDQAVGRLVAALDESGRMDQTVILFMSDNGAAASGGPWGNGPVDRIGLPTAPVSTTAGSSWAGLSNTPFRYYKGHAYEGGVRTPLIVHWPGLDAQPGSLRHQAGHLVDILPTVLDAAGLDRPSRRTADRLAVQGSSLLPLLVDADAERTEANDSAIYFEHEGRHGLRHGEWKLVAPKADSAWELYNLSQDPTETRDLAGEQPERVRELGHLWDAWAEQYHVVPLDESGWNQRIRASRKRSDPK